MNGFSEWIDINRVSTDFRITILHFTIDDVIAFCNPFFFNYQSIRNRFEQTYAHLKVDFPWFFSDFIEDPL